MAALLGALGAALGTMVANLSAHKRGWDARWDAFWNGRSAGRPWSTPCSDLVDDDTRAFNRVIVAVGHAQGTDAEPPRPEPRRWKPPTGARSRSPGRSCRPAQACFDLLEAMARDGHPASASDAGVGVLCTRAAILGAWLNVRTNAGSIKNRQAIAGILDEGARIDQDAARREEAILALVEARMAG